MKFSWQLLNNLVNLKDITYEKFKSKLILSGFELTDSIKYSKNKDYIMEIDITSNRKDASSIVGMAKEISSLFNLKLKITILNTYQYIKKPNYNINNEINIKYIRYNYITNLNLANTPSWLKEYLEFNNYYLSNNLLYSIQNYIKIKWGNDINYFDGNNTENIKALHKKQYNYLINKEKNHIKINSNNTIILCLFIYKNYNTENQHIYHIINAYNETINLLTTYGKCTVGKLFEDNYNLEYKKKQIIINQSYLNKILGPVINKKNNILTVKNNLNILNQLNLKPLYIEKKFQVSIPYYRQLDLVRDIDIAEEIARIYGFNNFVDKIPYQNKKGCVSRSRLILKKIKILLRSMGLNEVINSSIIKQDLQINHLKIYNPITIEQGNVRSNLLENLINNYNYNIKQKNYLIELFETGKTFYKIGNIFQEKIEISGILYNPNYIRLNWKNNSEHMNWFHAKGIIENLFEKLEANIYLQLMSSKEVKKINYLKNICNPSKVIGIYNQNNDHLIGIFTQIDKSYYKNFNKNQCPYVFTIDLEKLLTTIKPVNHLNYINLPYSNYPSITRDISINITDKYNILKIKKTIIHKYKQIIESIKVVNFYSNLISKIDTLCIRITYRSNSTTLENINIQHIHEEIEGTIQKLV